jgi:hypothetical protein
VGSNPTRGMNVCVCVVLCIGSGLATGGSPIQEVLLPVFRFKKLDSSQGPTKKCIAIEVFMAWCVINEAQGNL